VPAGARNPPFVFYRVHIAATIPADSQAIKMTSPRLTYQRLQAPVDQVHRK